MQRPMSAPSLAMLVLAGAAAFGFAVPLAQQPPAQSEGLTRAVQELTSELRSLRQVVERSERDQLQAHVLGVAVTFQQQRVALATGRLDAVRRELEALEARSSEVSRQIGAFESQISQEIDVAKRRDLEAEYRERKQVAELLAAEEQRVRNRETDAHQAAQHEEAAWREVVSRLEMLIRQ